MIYFLLYFLFVYTFKTNSFFNHQQIIRNNIYFISLSLITSELLSIFQLFNIEVIRLSLLFLLITYLIYNRNRISAKGLFNKIRLSYINLFTLFFIFIISYSSIRYFPTNFDSNVYHLPRIIIWLQNSNLNHFATPVYRMVYQPYLSEVIFALVYSSYGPITLIRFWSVVMLIQLFHSLSYLSSVLPVYYRLNRIQLSSVLLLCWSIILASTISLSDLQLLVFLVNIVSFTISFYYQKNIKSIHLLLVSVMLGFLTKGTFGIYFVCFLVFAMFKILIRGELGQFCLILVKNLKTNFLLTIYCILLVLPTIARNIFTSGSILGTSKEETLLYQNEPITLETGFSNTLKNLFMHSAVPSDKINDFNLKIVHKIHNFLHLPNVNSLNNNWSGLPYSINKHTKEFVTPEHIPNALLFYMSLVFGVIAVFKLVFRKLLFKESELFVKYTLICVTFLLFFSLLLKWQPWHTRLLLPILLFQSYILICYVNNFKLESYLHIVIFFFGFLIVIVNSNQPFLRISKITTTNFVEIDEYNLIKYAWHEEFKYKEINKKIGRNKTIGFYYNWIDERIFPYMYDARNNKNKYIFLGGFTNPTMKHFKVININKLDFIVLPSSDSLKLCKSYDIKHYSLVYKTPQLYNGHYWYLLKNNHATSN